MTSTSANSPVLPTGFHEIRHFGLAPSSHVRLGTLDRARAELAVGVDARAPAGRVPRSDTEILLALTGIDLRACAHYGGRPRGHASVTVLLRAALRPHLDHVAERM